MTMKTRMRPVDSAPCAAQLERAGDRRRQLATMPEKMISEMPLPMPRAVICSPSHIRNIVPPVRVTTVETRRTDPD